MYFWLLLRIYMCCLWLRLCSRVTYGMCVCVRVCVHVCVFTNQTHQCISSCWGCLCLFGVQSQWWPGENQHHIYRGESADARYLWTPHKHSSTIKGSINRFVKIGQFCLIWDLNISRFWLIRDLNISRFCSIRDLNISRFCSIRDLNISRFCSIRDLNISQFCSIRDLNIS